MKDNTTQLTSSQEEIKSGQIERFSSMGLGKSKEREEVALAGKEKLEEIKKQLDELEKKNKENIEKFEQIEKMNEEAKKELIVLEQTHSRLSDSSSGITKGKKRKRNLAGTPMPSHNDLFQLEQATDSLGFRRIAPRVVVNNGLPHLAPSNLGDDQSTLQPAIKKNAACLNTCLVLRRILKMITL